MLEVKTFKDLQDYTAIWQQMRDYTDTRNDTSADQIWLLQHHPVFTQGQAGKAEHILNPGDIPIVQSDRGGQVTYHGPGQLVAYILFDLKRAKINSRELVTRIENSVIGLLTEYGLTAKARTDAPGVYINNEKICSLGLRIRRGSSYHGLALNVDMDLTPFSRINPCGLTDIRITQLADFIPNIKIVDIEKNLIQQLEKQFI